jgi:hypothetical protein
VVGLDRKVVEGAIELKYRALQSGSGAEESPVKGSEYLRKIFQTFFTLPRFSPRQIDDFLASLDDAGLSVQQREDLWQRVRPHLNFVITEAGVNPREVKRYLNAYTLQRRMNPSLDADVVLCLQTLTFRSDWREAYEALLAEREVFTDAVRRQLDGNPAAVENLWPDLAFIPSSCFDYLGSLGMPLLQAPSLDPYLHNIESTHSALIDAYRVLGDLRGLMRDFASAATAERRRELQSDFTRQLPRLLGMLDQLPRTSAAARLQADLEKFVRRLEPERDGPVTTGSTEDDQAQLETWHRSAVELLLHIQTRLRQIQQLVTVGPTS